MLQFTNLISSHIIAVAMKLLASVGAKCAGKVKQTNIPIKRLFNVGKALKCILLSTDN